MAEPLAEARRFRLLIEYDGAAYGGWQIQPNAPSVQATLIKAARDLGTGDIDVQGSGRTDAGVHAFGQVAHLDLVTRLDADELHRALNAKLPRDIRVRTVQAVSDDFHARYSATSKRYLYVIDQARLLSVFARGRVWHVPGPLDIAEMRQAARRLVGRHDFSAFSSKANTRPDNVRLLRAIRILPGRHERLLLVFEGEGFLYNMVRTLVGALVAVGHDRLPPVELSAALDHGDRSRIPATAPPYGLYLWRVLYGRGTEPLPEGSC